MKSVTDHTRTHAHAHTRGLDSDTTMNAKVGDKEVGQHE
jgi:hypothetical protein